MTTEELAISIENPDRPPEQLAGGPWHPVILSSAEFVASFVPPEIAPRELYAGLIRAARQLEEPPHYEAGNHVAVRGEALTQSI